MQARLARIRWYIARIFQTWSMPAEWFEDLAVGIWANKNGEICVNE